MFLILAWSCCFSVSAALAQTPRVATALKIDTALVTLIEQAEIAARDAGLLEQLNVKEGALVEAEQLLAKLNDAEQQAARGRAAIAAESAAKQAASDVKLRFAKASHGVAQADYQRARDSVEKFQKSISQTELDQLRLMAEKTKLEIEQAEEDALLAALDAKKARFELAEAEAKLAKRQITAPFAGLITQLKKQRGEWVQPGDVVLRLIRTDRLRIEGFAPGKQVPANLLDAAANFKADLPGRGVTIIPGKVTFVSPEVNAVNGQIRIWIEVDNRENLLRPGQVGSLEIALPPSAVAEK